VCGVERRRGLDCRLGAGGSRDAVDVDHRLVAGTVLAVLLAFARVALLVGAVGGDGRRRTAAGRRIRATMAIP
jgi:hypothetical protein